MSPITTLSILLPILDGRKRKRCTTWRVFRAERKKTLTSKTKLNSTDSKSLRKKKRRDTSHCETSKTPKHSQLRWMNSESRNTAFLTFRLQQTIELVPLLLPCVSILLPKQPLDTFEDGLADGMPILVHERWPPPVCFTQSWYQ